MLETSLADRPFDASRRVVFVACFDLKALWIASIRRHDDGAHGCPFPRQRLVDQRALFTAWRFVVDGWSVTRSSATQQTPRDVVMMEKMVGG